MGAFKGSITYSKFHVRGELPENYAGGFVRRIKNRVFEPLTPDSDDPQHWGWCSVLDPFDLELDHEKIFFNSYLNLGLRIDRWAIPSTLFKAHFAQAAKALSEKKQRERLTRKEKDELRETVMRRLRKQLLPSMKVIDVSWNVETGVLRYWSRSKKAVELMNEMFEKTFSLKLLPYGPYAVAAESGFSQEELERFNMLELTSFHAEAAE